MKQISSQEKARVRALVETYFAQARSLDQLKVHKFATWAKVSKNLVNRILPENQWDTLYHVWSLSHVRQAMDEVYQNATSQSDFLLKEIAQQAKVSLGLVATLIRDEWLARRATLPTKDEYIRQKILATLKLMVDESVPLATLTREQVQVRAGVSVPHVEGTWFTEAIHAARWELQQKQKEHDPVGDLNSVEELNAVLEACLVDVKTGIDFVQKRGAAGFSRTPMMKCSSLNLLNAPTSIAATSSRASLLEEWYRLANTR